MEDERVRERVISGGSTTGGELGGAGFVAFDGVGWSDGLGGVRTRVGLERRLLGGVSVTLFSPSFSRADIWRLRLPPLMTL